MHMMRMAQLSVSPCFTPLSICTISLRWPLIRIMDVIIRAFFGFSQIKLSDKSLQKNSEMLRFLKNYSVNF